VESSVLLKMRVMGIKRELGEEMGGELGEGQKREPERAGEGWSNNEALLTDGLESFPTRQGQRRGWRGQRERVDCGVLGSFVGAIDKDITLITTVHTETVVSTILLLRWHEGTTWKGGARV
jgi:hypothetical protein